MGYVGAFLMVLSVATLAQGENGIHELASQRASKYELITVTQLEGNRPMKSLSTHTGSKLHYHSTTFHLKIGNHDNIDKNATEWTVDLNLNLDLVSSNFKFYSTGSKASSTEYTNSYEHCYYHGNIRGLLESSVSLSTCGGGVKGFIFDGTDLYHLDSYGEEGGHFMYHSGDTLDENGMCGVEGDNSSSQSNFGQTILRQKRAQANKFVEFYLIMDRAHFQLTGSSTDISRQYAIEVANHMDFIYRNIGVRIALVGAEVWTNTEFIQTNNDLDILLENWIAYLPTLKSNRADAGLHFDNAHIITGLSNSESNVIGKAPLNSMCFSGSGGVNRDTTGSLATRVATTLSHEMGHNFGMEHDDGRQCNDCPDENRGCVMNAFLRNPSPFQFSSCSSEDLHSALNRGVGTCIYNSPPRLFTDPICGNAFVEEGEECDCGSLSECPDIDPCCEPGVCKLYQWAECGSGDCCNNCSYSQEGVVCREVAGNCDIAEKCTGDTNMCPDNLYRRNGLSCTTGSADSFCYEGACRTLLDQCHYVWGTEARVAADICYERVNAIGDVYGNCGMNEQGSYLPCEASNVKCGKLHCDVESGSRPVILGSYTVTYFTYPGALCTAISINAGDMVDPGYVPDGTLCDDTSVCVMGVCTNVTELPFISCPVGTNGLECSGEAECSNTGVCVGIDIPIVHSSNAVVIVVCVVVVVVVMLAFIVAGILIGYWLYINNAARSKPVSTSGRTRGASLTEMVATKFSSLPRYSNLPPNKNSVNSSQPPPRPASRPPPRASPPKQPPPRIQKK